MVNYLKQRYRWALTSPRPSVCTPTCPLSTLPVPTRHGHIEVVSPSHSEYYMHQILIHTRSELPRCPGCGQGGIWPIAACTPPPLACEWQSNQYLYEFLHLTTSIDLLSLSSTEHTEDSVVTQFSSGRTDPRQLVGRATFSLTL